MSALASTRSEDRAFPLLFALAFALFASVARAEEPCAGKAAGASCTSEDGKRGNCASEKCAHADAAPYDCMRCRPAADTTSGGSSSGGSAGTNATRSSTGGSASSGGSSKSGCNAGGAAFLAFAPLLRRRRRST